MTVRRSGKRDRIVVYCSIAGDGARLTRSYEKFDKDTFVEYLKEVRRKWGKVLVITDNASQHSAGVVREYLEDNGDAGILYLPVATPKLSVVEAVWKDAQADHV